MDKKLERNENEKVIGGVAAGLADYLDMEIWLVRAIFVALFIFGSAGFWIYLVLWIAVPARPFNPFEGFEEFQPRQAKSQYAGYQAPPSPHSARPAQAYSTVKKESDGSFRLIAGLVLTLLGLYFLLMEFNMIPYWFSVQKLWPVIFIIIGLVFLATAGRKREKTASFDDSDAAFESKDSDSGASNNGPTNFN